MKTVFVDGAAGTTGLKILDRLSDREDIKVITLEEKYRKDVSARKDMLNSCNVAFLCLPDAAAQEAVSLIENNETVVIDTSTAHRTAPGWVYGFPELKGQRDLIANSKRIANPGCHASGVIALIKPLIDGGVLKPDAKITSFSLTGYSGGGKKMILDYENTDNAGKLAAPRMYGISQSHKHLPEITKICGLTYTPVFCPIVSSYYSGMQVTVPLFADDVRVGIDGVKKIYSEYYKTNIVKYAEDVSDNGFLSSGGLSGFDDMQITVLGNEERLTLVSRFDNLGKGASGAAIQNMNICLGIEENTGLKISEENL